MVIFGVTLKDVTTQFRFKVNGTDDWMLFTKENFDMPKYVDPPVQPSLYQLESFPLRNAMILFKTFPFEVNAITNLDYLL